MALLDDLKWRYATKKMNGKSVPQTEVYKIIEAAYLAPTSSGLQPFEVFVITNQELKEKIYPIALNQSQVVDSSHLLVFAAWDDYTEERINSVYDYIMTERNLPNDPGLNAYKERLKKNFVGRASQLNFEHAARQAYIALGLAVAQAAELKVDSVPMEGFSSEELDELLGLNKKGLKSVLLMPLGYRDEENDWLVNMKKVRRPKDEFLTEIK